MELAPNKLLIAKLTEKAKEKGITLKEAVRLSEIPAEHYYDWMKNNSFPTDEELKSICSTLGCDASSLLKSVNASAKVQTNSEQQKNKENSKKTEDKTMSVPTETITKDSVKEESKKVSEPSSAAKTPVQKQRKRKTSQRLFSEEAEALIRKSTGAKKTSEVTFETAVSAIDILTNHLTENVLAISTLAKNVTSSYSESANNPPKPDERFASLLKEAESASDEGLKMAIAILKKFKK